MVTRAVHLQVVSDLTAKSFINVLRRFATVCSVPRYIISDQGTNLSETAKFIRGMPSEALVNGYLINHDIEWKFIHVRSPWEGGFYERMIGVTKSCLRKLLYRKSFTHEELITLVAEVQARVNNRPLCYVSDERLQYEALTPSHLLCGRVINTMPPLELDDHVDPTFEVDHRLLYETYSHISKLINKFECVFEREYLTALRARFYGNDTANNTTPLQVGDVVLLEAGTNRERWPLGKILELLPDSNGIVRAVKILSRGRESVQSVTKLVPMEVTGPNPLRAQEEDVIPEQPEVPANLSQRPLRAAAEQAVARNRGLFEDGLA